MSNQPRTDPAITIFAENHYLVAGELTFATVPRVWEESQAVLRDLRHHAINLDLRDVRHADSAALAFLVEWLRAARRLNISISLLNMPQQLESVAKVTGLYRLLPTIDEDRQASTRP